jgi:L-threonylcarbamoyladenylate synthase
LLRTLCQQFGGPIISTSANIAGQFPARDSNMLELLFEDQIPVILDGKTGNRSRPSQIIDVITGDTLRE